MKAKITELIEKNKTENLVEFSVEEVSIPAFKIICKFKGKYEKTMEKHIIHEKELTRLIEVIKSEMKKCAEEE